MRVFTVQMANHRLVKEQNIKLIDTTVKSGDPAFAPTWDMVKLIKDNTVDGKTTVDAMATYTCLYKDMMKVSQSNNPKLWMGLFHDGDIAVACYCKAGQFCHRHLLVEMLTEYAMANSLSIEPSGEIMSASYVPTGDGIDHINVYTKGNTVLGRALSHMSEYDLIHPIHGNFASLEAFYYYVAYFLDGTDVPYGSIRDLDGYAAKAKAKEWKHKLNDDQIYGTMEFRQLFLEGHKARLDRHPALKTALQDSKLPLTHYYYYGDKDNCKVIDAGGIWWLKYLESLK